LSAKLQLRGEAADFIYIFFSLKERRIGAGTRVYMRSGIRHGLTAVAETGWVILVTLGLSKEAALAAAGILAPKLQKIKASDEMHTDPRNRRRELLTRPLEVIPEEGEVGVGEERRVLLARLHELPELAGLGGIHRLPPPLPLLLAR